MLQVKTMWISIAASLADRIGCATIPPGVLIRNPSNKWKLNQIVG